MADNSVLISGQMAHTMSRTHTLGACHRFAPASVLIDNVHTHTTAIQSTIKGCLNSYYIGFITLGKSAFIADLASATLYHCAKIASTPFIRLYQCQHTTQASTKLLYHCHGIGYSALEDISLCYSAVSSPTALLQTKMGTRTDHAHSLKACHSNTIKPAVAVPCRYYPIIDKPIIIDAPICAPLPPSNRLPLTLRNTNPYASNAIALMLGCYQYAKDIAFNPKPTNPSTSPSHIYHVHTPSLGNYIMHHSIHAAIGDIIIDPISFNANTDIASFCYTMGVQISQSDFVKVQHLFDRPRGQEPIIRVDIDEYSFVFIGEEISHTREFGKSSVTIQGRSVSAHLSKDYTIAAPITDDLYASQIVHTQLENLPISADFKLDDWRIEGGYNSEGKTPIGVLDDIAKACGGFLYSDIAKPVIYLLPKYKVAAWDLANTTPDHILPLSAISKLSIQKQRNPRYNSVACVGQIGGIVHRASEGRDKGAPVNNNPLYTQKECIVNAGIALLSDSGNHSRITIDTILSKTHHLPLATLGQIWQINDTISYKGIIISHSIEASVQDGVPTVRQSIALDRYDDV